MIISEKQIMQLIRCAEDLMRMQDYPLHMRDCICKLLIEIENQQSEELKVIDDPLDPKQYCQISGSKLDKSCRECGLDRPIGWKEILDDYVHGKDEIKVCKTCHNQYVKIIDCEHGSLEETDMRKCFKCGAIYS